MTFPPAHAPMTRHRSSVVWALFLLTGFVSLPPALPAQEKEQVKGVLAEPADAREIREQVAQLEELKSAVPSRGAVPFLLAIAKLHLGETREALELLKKSLAMKEGFDPSGEPAFLGWKSTKEFDDLVEQVHRDFPIVAQARLAFVTQEKDLIPEGLAYDERRKLFYMGSLNRKKIVEIDLEGRVSDFVPGDRYGLLPVLGIRLDPTDGTVWADTFEDAGRTELVHFDATGKLLERFGPEDSAKHGLNDLVVRKNGEVITTDSLSNQVLRFDPRMKTFTALKIYRPLFYPNGIALADDDQTIYAADAVGIIRVKLIRWETATWIPVHAAMPCQGRRTLLAQRISDRGPERHRIPADCCIQTLEERNERDPNNHPGKPDPIPRTADNRGPSRK